MSEIHRSFIEFVQRGKEVLPLLPLVYTTNVCFFEKILGERVICRRMCGVHKKKLCYLFYGKPPYQLKIRNAPGTNILGSAKVYFLIKPSFIRLFRLFAVNTGALRGKGYDAYLPSGINIADFEMPPTQIFIAKFVSAFFGSNKNYCEGKVSTSTLYSRNASEVFINLAKMNAFYSCEIQTDMDVPLNSETLQTVVIPSGLADNREVINACAQWGIKPILYRFKRSTPESQAGLICEKLAEFYKRLGYF